MNEIINNNKTVIDNLSNFVLTLSNHLMEQIIYQNKLMANGFNKLFYNIKVSFIQNMMWIFFNQIIELKPESLSFITKSIFKYLYNHKLVTYAKQYLNNQENINLNTNFLQLPFYNNYYNLFIRTINNKHTNEKLLYCYKSNRLILSRLQQKWKSNGWEAEYLEQDNSLPSNNKNINYNGQYLDHVIYSQIKLIAYQMNEIILSSSQILYN